MDIATITLESKKPHAVKTVVKPDWLSDEDFALLRTCNGSSDDAKWFERYPKRTHRLRWAEQVEITSDLEASCPKGFFIAIAVIQITQGARHRQPFFFQGSLPQGAKAAEDTYNWSISSVPKEHWKNLTRILTQVVEAGGLVDSVG